jgi:poly-gamma-glutamate synthesis protein (capsule biosynthesis protein)
VAPNGITMSNADEVLINTFNSNDLDAFYTRIEGQIADMKSQGAEGIVLYIHWGVEYQLKENSTQNTIAQKMCDLGVDVIVGGHPHVIQPMELLTSTVNEDHKTLCIYSTGNALSNQRRDLMRLDTGHTEDGILFNFTFSKYSDGTVRVEQADVLPTWVYKYRDGGKDAYRVYPLDAQVEDWKAQFDMSSSVEKEARASYDRTMKIVGEGLTQIQDYLSSLPPVAVAE